MSLRKKGTPFPISPLIFQYLTELEAPEQGAELGVNSSGIPTQYFLFGVLLILSDLDFIDYIIIHSSCSD